MVRKIFTTAKNIFIAGVFILLSVFLLSLKLILVMLLFIWIIVLLAVHSLVRMLFSNGENFRQED